MPAGLQVRAPGNRRSRVQLAPRKRSSVQCPAMPSRRTRNTGANAEGTTAQHGITCGVQAPTLRAAIGAAGGPKSLLSCRPGQMPKTRWRVAQLAEQRVLVPQVEGSNPSPPARIPRGNAGRTTAPTCRRLPNPLSPGPETPRRMPCGTTGCPLVVAGSSPAGRQ